MKKEVPLEVELQDVFTAEKGQKNMVVEVIVRDIAA